MVNDVFLKFNGILKKGIQGTNNFGTTSESNSTTPSWKVKKTFNYSWSKELDFSQICR